uniref:Transposase MuDR plant domain-containing protein n=1 Tax=Brassica oleracea var. oleracea TaxID=109376 RepID=A0A0D3DQW0_BRAOL
MFRLVEPGGTPAESYRATPPPAADVEAIATDISNTRINEPCLDLSLGVGSASNIARVDLVIDVDSSSDAEDVSGNQTIGYDHLYQGRVFSSRDDFKHHMALYALRHKFRFRHTRSSPDKMVFCCVSLKCMWRVYAIKLKNVENFEIRRVQLQHTCSIDERAGNF